MKEYKYISISEGEERNGKPSYIVKNRFYLAIIGLIVWSDIALEWCYWPECPYWHGQIVLSHSNMGDIMKFIEGLT